MVTNKSEQVVETEACGLLVAPESPVWVIQQALLTVLEQTHDYLDTEDHTGLYVQMLLFQSGRLVAKECIVNIVYSC